MLLSCKCNNATCDFEGCVAVNVKPLLLDLESNNVFPPCIFIELQNISNCSRLLGYPNGIVTFNKRTGLHVFVNNMKHTEFIG